MTKKVEQMNVESFDEGVGMLIATVSAMEHHPSSEELLAQARTSPDGGDRDEKVYIHLVACDVCAPNVRKVDHVMSGEFHPEASRSTDEP